MDNNTAVFTITKGDKGYNIKSKRYNLYNCYNVKEDDIFTAMQRLTDTFNNALEIGILFEVA